MATRLRSERLEVRATKDERALIDLAAAEQGLDADSAAAWDAINRRRGLADMLVSPRASARRECWPVPPVGRTARAPRGRRRSRRYGARRSGWMFADVIIWTLALGEEVGCRGLLVHAETRALILRRGV